MKLREILEFELGEWRRNWQQMPFHNRSVFLRTGGMIHFINGLIRWEVGMLKWPFKKVRNLLVLFKGKMQ